MTELTRRLALWSTFRYRTPPNTSTGISVPELGVFAKPSGIMAFSAKVSVPNAVERPSSGPSASKEESNSTQVKNMNRQDRRAGQNVVRGTQAAVYTYLATVYTTLGIRPRPTRPTRPGFL